jgi:hypothetical protein
MPQTPGHWVSEAAREWIITPAARHRPAGKRYPVSAPLPMAAGPNPWVRSSSRRSAPFADDGAHTPLGFQLGPNYYRPQGRFAVGVDPHCFTMGVPLGMGSSFVMRPGTASPGTRVPWAETSSAGDPGSTTGSLPFYPAETQELPPLGQRRPATAGIYGRQGMFQNPSLPLRYRARDSARSWGSSRMGFFTGAENGMDMQVRSG